MWETREFLLQKKLNTSVISINAVHSFVPQVMWNREGWWSSGYHMNTVATKRFVWSERKVVNKHSKWSSEGGNKVVCVEQTNNYYAPEPQTTVCGKIPLLMRYASLALRTRLHWHVPLCVPSAEFTLLIDQREPVWSHVVKIPVTAVFSVLLNIIKGIINYVYICFVTNG